MGISGTATGGGGAVWPRLEAAKRTVPIAQLAGPLRLRVAGDVAGDAGPGNPASLPRGVGPGFHPFRVAIDASIWWVARSCVSAGSHASQDVPGFAVARIAGCRRPGLVCTLRGGAVRPESASSDSLLPALSAPAQRPLPGLCV